MKLRLDDEREILQWNSLKLNTVSFKLFTQSMHLTIIKIIMQI